MTGKNYLKSETGSDILSDPVGYGSKWVNDKFWQLAEGGARAAFGVIDRLVESFKNGPSIEVAPSPSRGRPGYASSRSYDSGEPDSDIEFVSKLERYLSDVKPVRIVRTDKKGLLRAYGKPHKGPLFAVSTRENGGTIYARRFPKFVNDYFIGHEISELDTPGVLDDTNLDRHFTVDRRTLDAYRYIWKTSENKEVGRRARNAYITGLAVSRIGKGVDSLSSLVSRFYRVPEVIDKLVQSVTPDVEVALQEG